MINTTLCYIEHDDCYLMLLRNKKKNDLNAQKWIGVGGKFLPGETADDCLIREVWEETGLRLTSHEIVGVIKFISDIDEDEEMFLYKGLSFEGELIEDCPEGELHWIPKGEVLSLPTWEGDRYFLEPFIEGRKNLNMTVRYENHELVEVIDNTEPVKTLKSSIISSPHGFSTRVGGVSFGCFESLNLGMNRGDDPALVCENWRRFLESADIDYEPFVYGKQVHRNYVHTASKEDAHFPCYEGEWIEADGIVTNKKNLALAISTADCVPVLLEDSQNGVIGAVHSGWRSTMADIEGEAVSKMLSLGAKAATIKAAVGPAIEQCCFEVGKEVIDAAKSLIGMAADDCFYQKENQKYMLDLKKVIKLRLIQLGLKAENIESVGECTMCNPKTYYSHRYSNGSRGSLFSIIMMK